MTGTNKTPGEEWFYPSHNFGAVPSSLCGLESSRIVVLPVPYEATTTYRSGCHAGPGAIIEASANMELYDEELRREPCEVGIHTLPPMDVVDDPLHMIQRIDAVATEHLKKMKFVTMLGGEHSISLGMVQALHRFHSDLSVLVLDAHADFRDSYRGNKHSHACIGRRISEICRLTQAGVRSLSSEEAHDLERGGVVTCWAQEVRESRNSGGLEAITNRIIESLSDHVYISVDADVFDPSIMPAVGTPEPGGLLWDEVVCLLRGVADAKHVVGLDLVELAPIPGIVHSEFMAARLIYKMWGYVLTV